MDLMDYKFEPSEKVELSLARRVMIKSMTSAWATPMATQECDFNAANVIAVKKELGVTYNDIFTKALANVLSEEGRWCNGSLHGEEVWLYDDVNISVAVANDEGLWVPVILQANKKTVEEISANVKELVEKINNHTITMDEMAFGTVTISNLGNSACECGAPIVRPPQGIIVFMGNMRKMPIVDENDNIVVGRAGRISMTYDHRFIDGKAASVFTTAFHKLLTNLTVEDMHKVY